MKEFTHFLRLGTHAEAETFRKAISCFDVLVLNANLVEGSPAACAALVYQMRKPFIIDPYTYAFAVPHHYLLSRGKGKLSQNELKPKRSFLGLASRYFGDASFVGVKSLTPESVDAAGLAKNTLTYQSERLREAVGDPSESVIAASPLLVPLFNIAPYFPIVDDLRWLATNIACLSSAVAIDENVCGVLAVGGELLESSYETIVKGFVGSGVTQILIWIDRFDEDKAKQSELDSYMKLVEDFSGAGISCINLFGGFFSCLAETKGLRGFAHGLGYGENRGIIPVLGGGQPPPRYYARPLHTSVPVLDAAVTFSSLSSEDYLQKVCDCVICTHLLDEGGVDHLFSSFAETDERGRFVPRAYALSRFHFLLSRKKEIESVVPMGLREKVDYLVKDELILKELDAEHFAAHLALWKRQVEN